MFEYIYVNKWTIKTNKSRKSPPQFQNIVKFRLRWIPFLKTKQQLIFLHCFGSLSYLGCLAFAKFKEINNRTRLVDINLHSFMMNRVKQFIKMSYNPLEIWLKTIPGGCYSLICIENAESCRKGKCRSFLKCDILWINVLCTGIQKCPNIWSSLFFWDPRLHS